MEHGYRQAYISVTPTDRECTLTFRGKTLSEFFLSRYVLAWLFGFTFLVVNQMTPDIATLDVWVHDSEDRKMLSGLVGSSFVESTGELWVGFARSEGESTTVDIGAFRFTSIESLPEDPLQHGALIQWSRVSNSYAFVAGGDRWISLAADPAGGLYIALRTLPENSWTGIRLGRASPDGSLEYAVQLGAPERAIAVHPLDSVVNGGNPWPPPIEEREADPSSLVMVKFSYSGRPMWAQSIGESWGCATGLDHFVAPSGAVVVVEAGSHNNITRFELWRVQWHGCAYLCHERGWCSVDHNGVGSCVCDSDPAASGSHCTEGTWKFELLRCALTIGKEHCNRSMKLMCGERLNFLLSSVLAMSSRFTLRTVSCIRVSYTNALLKNSKTGPPF